MSKIPFFPEIQIPRDNDQASSTGGPAQAGRTRARPTWTEEKPVLPVFRLWIFVAPITAPIFQTFFEHRAVRTGTVQLENTGENQMGTEHRVFKFWAPYIAPSNGAVRVRYNTADYDIRNLQTSNQLRIQLYDIGFP